MEVGNQTKQVPVSESQELNHKDFVTVVAVGVGGDNESSKQNQQNGENTNDKPFVTVLTIGDENKENKEVSEEVLVYRLPGERLGFGLKFEGGTKTSECVRRLFIQSCAPDSPASRVTCSWGSLVEGDEVIEIDAQPVKNMTRIDCVRCLKDSNVVIKLLVKHNSPPSVDIDEVDRAENLPLVVKAEKKRLPPPPPVPPRKVSRKHNKEPAIIPPRAFVDDKITENGCEKLQNGVSDDKPSNLSPPSPKTKIRQQLDIPPRIRDRRLSDGSNGPPDAEVYLDLLSQELEYGLRAESESDDTGSTISTVMDKHANSCFSERCSIASDSIPSTPTPRQKQFDLSKVLNPFEILEMEFEPNNNHQSDEYLLNKLNGNPDLINEIGKNNLKNQDKIKDIIPVQSPANFLDAHLSYGNEDVRTISRSTENINNNDNWIDTDDKTIEMNKINKLHENQTPKPTPRKCYAKRSPPPQPPQIIENSNEPQDQIVPEKLIINDVDEKPILPRLVNVIPKTPTKDLDNSDAQIFDIQKNLSKEIDNNNDIEKFDTVPAFEEGNSYLSLDIVSLEKISDFRTGINDCDKECEEIGCDDIDDEKFFIFKWSSSGQLATIGEDEEFETTEDSSQKQSNPPSTPIVIVEKADEIIDDNNKNDDMIYEENINNNPKGNALTEMNEKSIVPTDISSTNTADYNHTANTDNATSNELIQNAEQDMDTSALDKPDGEASNCNGHMDSSEEETEEKSPKWIEEPDGTSNSSLELLCSSKDKEEQNSNSSGFYETMEVTTSKEKEESSSPVQNSPPPSSSRLPPDGHEFPNYQEVEFERPYIMEPNSTDHLSAINKFKSPPPPIPLKRSTITTNKESDMIKPPSVSSRLSYINNDESKNNVASWLKNDKNVMPERKVSLGSTSEFGNSRWKKDEKSAGSVKDKIAIFSSSTDTEPVFPQSPNIINKKLNKFFKSSDDIFKDSSDKNKNVKPNLYKSTSKIDTLNVISNNLKNDSNISTSVSDFTKYNSDSNKLWPKSNLSYPDRSASSVDLSSTSTIKTKTEDDTKDKFYTLPKKISSTVPESNNSNFQDDVSNLKSRSQSMTDVAGSRISQIYRTTSMVGAYPNQDTADSRRLALNSLIEQRRRSMSKLKGLVIPEKVVEISTVQPVVDLPEIKSVDAIIPNKKIFNKEDNVKETTPLSTTHQRSSSVNSTINLSSPPWKSNYDSNITKYSPAFKRKSLQVYGTSTYNSNETDSIYQKSKLPELPIKNNDDKIKSNNFNPDYQIPSLPEPTKPNETVYVETITSPTCSDYSYDYSNSLPDMNSLSNIQTEDSLKSFQDQKSEMKTEVESDNDSAVSSSQSSYSKDFSSPPASLQDTNYRRNTDVSAHIYTQTSTEERFDPTTDKMTITKTYSSEATISVCPTKTSRSNSNSNNYDSLNRRILKAQSVEAINRKNILASAKCRSGQDLNSPLIQRKFDESESICTNDVITKQTSLPNNLGTEDSAYGSDLYKDTNQSKFSDYSDNSMHESSDNSLDFDIKLREPIKNNSKTNIWEKSDTKYNSSPVTKEVEKISDKITNDYDVFKNKTTDLKNPIKPEVKSRTTSLINNNNNNINNFAPSKPSRLSTSELKKNFEKVTPITTTPIRSISKSVTTTTNTFKLSTTDSSVSESSSRSETRYKNGSTSSLTNSDFDSLNSSITSTSQDLEQLVSDVNQSLDDLSDNLSTDNVEIIVLQRGTAGGSIGITLTGGIDYESKAITVHKVLNGSPAHKNGRLNKGDRVLSINGKSMLGLTHKESIDILKAPSPEVTLVISRKKDEVFSTSPTNGVKTSVSSKSITSSVVKTSVETTPPVEKSPPSPTDKSAPICVTLVKDKAGLGFSLDGGFDSPLGNKPLVIKKIFTGGAAEKCGELQAGVELLGVNNVDINKMTRIEVWGMMKKLPEGEVLLKIRKIS